MFSRKIIDQVEQFNESADLDEIEKAFPDWNPIAYCEKALREVLT